MTKEEKEIIESFELISMVTEALTEKVVVLFAWVGELEKKIEKIEMGNSAGNFFAGR